ncbi:olfactory receptor 6P1-like [Trachemys scripta elegans]|uniref:Olfactory receptor n=1 Tax=Chrysemys picta bellii TaxID=8478 RepID=A0A8C3F2S9_CHRPI|nr:olfactory receptor 6P1-like [Chrysemys picta bellii]XP_034643627.1 olfactory receptor 6P1-like [Trachemys scripta elegans]
MKKENQSSVQEFILLGFPTALKEVQILLFLIFLFIYMLTLVENMVIIVAVQVSYPLHKPMYLFLSSLSFLEIWYITVTVPKMLLDLLRGSQHISFLGCMAQLYFFIALACTECVLLAVMAYDRYVAICSPLRYSAIMTHGLCFCLVAGSWVSGFTSSMLKVVFISRLTFCGSVINHFFCDISPLLNLACTDMSLAERVDFILALIMILLPLLVVVASYACIVVTVVRIPTAQGRWKAFSTCTSHLMVVIIFYSTTLFTYARPRAMYAFDSNKLVSMLYTVIVPFFNPVIYCLRNQDVKKALRKMIRGRSKPENNVLGSQIG